MTMPERVLWNRLKDRQLGGFKFRRQHPLGAYVADFYCAEATLVVELDGSGHRFRRQDDSRKDAFLGTLGLRVLRFSVSEFTRYQESVLQRILDAALAAAGKAEKE